MTKRLLILDQASLKTGFAVWVPGSPPLLGRNTLPNTGEDIGLFLAKFERWFDDMCIMHKINIAAFEVPWVGAKTNQNTARKLMSLAGFIEYLCTKRDIYCTEAVVRDWRRHFIGSGNLKRELAQRRTMDECVARGIEPRNQDEADAFGILDYTAYTLEIEPDWAKHALLAKRAS